MSSISPESVCLKPLFPDSTDCATQSTFQWWQNDLDLFLTEFSREDYKNNCELKDDTEGGFLEKSEPVQCHRKIKKTAHGICFRISKKNEHYFKLF